MRADPAGKDEKRAHLTARAGGQRALDIVCSDRGPKTGSGASGHHRDALCCEAKAARREPRVTLQRP